MIYVPQDIVELYADNIPDVEPLWNNVTSYSVGSIVRVGNYQYKSTLDSNVNNSPLTTLGIYWVELQPANDYAMLDLESGYKTQWNTTSGYATFFKRFKDYIGVGGTNANIIKIEYLDNSLLVIETETYTFSNNYEVYDAWTYGYGTFAYGSEYSLFKPLKRIGYYVKVTLESTHGLNVYASYLVSGKGVSAGITTDVLSLPDKRENDVLINTVNFETLVRNNTFSRVLNSAKLNTDIPMLYAVDDSEQSVYDNMVIVGKATSITGTPSNYEMNVINWTLEQTNINK